MGRIFGSFDQFITPVIIKIIFWIMVALFVIGGLGIIVQGFEMARFGGSILGLLGLIGGLFVMAIGIVFARVYAELVILGFKIHSELKLIRRAQAPGADPDGDEPRMAAPRPGPPRSPGPGLRPRA